ncbi:hypothetical protein LOCC1_G000073 [Lachnellula occidentalis]|uniref:Uncharacterized protein n=1 Tax=Lachnellula occidentalis TaxID=215460 RepID=A0A8H8UIL5_9HELO|nr:hypothetical protein LOCC1_G000073 [Lachnellula occidentalis]
MSALGLNIHNTHVDSSDDENEEEPRLSEIRITVNTPLMITGDGNSVSVDVALNASKVSAAVVAALRGMSTVAGGVPMIDGDGRPRPITMEVTAEIKVEGSNNVVGDKAILSKTVAGSAFQKGREEEEQVAPKTPDALEGQEAQGRVKRDRGVIERSEMEPKRIHHDQAPSAAPIDRDPNCDHVRYVIFPSRLHLNSNYTNIPKYANGKNRREVG